MKGILIVLAVWGLALAQDPTVITIEYDDYNGYGTAPLTAITNLWPACTVNSFNGNPAGWADAVDSSTSIAIADMHNYTLQDAAAFSYLTDWYNDPALGPIWYADWGMSQSYSDLLKTAMGVTAVSAVYMPPITHYLWEAGSPIGTGITDWSYADPGYGTGANRLTVGTATPITGWTATPTAGQAAICVAPDGNSIISGYFASLNPTQAVPLWENILNFMWGSSGPGLSPSTWGDIKTQFGR
jgi:hypothetical protein